MNRAATMIVFKVLTGRDIITVIDLLGSSLCGALMWGESE